jgi:pre-mRNA branch site protein p14
LNHVSCIGLYPDPQPNIDYSLQYSRHPVNTRNIFSVHDLHSHQDMSRAGKLAPEQLPVLFIKNLNYEVTDGDLFKLFDPDETGIIRQIRKGISGETKGTAYVVFWNAMDAKNALEKLNGFNFQNRYLVVLWHQPEKTLKMKESKEDVQARQESLGQLKKQYGID